jgi:hypothetical protein
VQVLLSKNLKQGGTAMKEEKPGLIEELKIKTETFYATQGVRIQAQLRIKAFVRDERLDKLHSKQLHGWLDDSLKDREDYIKKDVETILKDVNIWTDFMKKVKGIGPCLAGSLIAGIQDPGKFQHVSALWKYIGLDVVAETGEAPRRTRGEKITWNPFLRMTLHKLTDSFIKQDPDKSLYRRLYDQKKAFYQGKFPEHNICRKCGAPHELKIKKSKPDKKTGKVTVTKSYVCTTKGCKEVGTGIPHPTRQTKDKKPIYYHTRDHIHRMAKRYAGKIFIQHLWITWRKQKGLEVNKPWILEHGGHVDYIEPEEAMAA